MENSTRPKIYGGLHPKRDQQINIEQAIILKHDVIIDTVSEESQKFNSIFNNKSFCVVETTEDIKTIRMVSENHMISLQVANGKQAMLVTIKPYGGLTRDLDQRKDICVLELRLPTMEVNDS